MKVPLSVLRLRKEMETICISPNDTIAVEEKENGSASITYSMYLTEGVYAHKRYTFMINIGNSYPFSPPKAVCITPVLHPSIDDQGRVCMNITREDWSIKQGIQSVIFGLSSIFYDVPIQDPFNEYARNLYLESKERYVQEVERLYKSKL